MCVGKCGSTAKAALCTATRLAVTNFARTLCLNSQSSLQRKTPPHPQASQVSKVCATTSASVSLKFSGASPPLSLRRTCTASHRLAPERRARAKAATNSRISGTGHAKR
eukprot:gnl/MRDRNA2_/MRDRNA2_41717_c0_seq1.p1 gnl/MRDRNA2_/MRDRNA2_41717_c0~~gnl/MRDRNA2_/MRDRNA2_41717_c0_seq1.p1  ORF type:complete len:109 (-),score=10.46 gnl/MRDRNA2_/MRDRNA2_41717_c0_seq1:354-680(-)